MNFPEIINQRQYEIINLEKGEWVEGIGGESRKSFSRITYRDNEDQQREEQVLIKSFSYKNSIEKAREFAAIDYSNYIQLRDIGLPVPDIALVFEDDDGPQIAYSDLTAGGTNTVWSFSNISTEFVRMHLTQNDLVKFKDQIIEIANLIEESEGKTVVAPHGYFVVGNESEGYRLVIGDFGDSIYEAENIEEAKKRNIQSYEDLVSVLEMYTDIKD